MNRTHLFALAGTLALSGIATAAGVDGSTVGDNLGPAASVQTVNTEFGNNFSELNAAYGKIGNGLLHMVFTGNLEANFNKFNVFLDTKAGGQNTINGASNPNNDNWAAKYNGFTFDTGFNPDYVLIFRHGNGGTKFDVDFAKIGGGAADGGLLGSFDNSMSVGNLSNSFGGTNVNMQVKLDNSNVAGISGGNGAADQAAALAVTTGLEFTINLDALDITGPIKVSAHVNGSSHDYLSNQSLGGFTAPQGNLGTDGAGGFVNNSDLSRINLNQYAGNQYFEVVPEPGTMIALGLGAAALVARRRRKNG